MLRFVLGPDRTLVADLAARLPGRGMWLSARADVLETARSRGAFAKACRGPVTVPPDLDAILRDGLCRRIADLLGFARRAGQAVCGFQKAREWLLSGPSGPGSGGTGRTGSVLADPGFADPVFAGLVVQACDGSPEERARFLGGRTDVPVVAPLPAATLGTVFGRDHVVHVVIAPGRLASSIATEAGRLAGLTDPAAAGGETSALARHHAGQRGTRTTSAGRSGRDDRIERTGA